MSVAALFFGGCCGIVAAWLFVDKVFPWIVWQIIRRIDPSVDDEPKGPLTGVTL